MIAILKKNVALIPIRDADKIGHIWVPDTAKERVDQGVVKYVGPDCKFARIGAYVTFSGYSGTLMDISDPEYPDRPSETVIIVDEDFLHAEILDMPSTDVPGLFFRDVEGEYFPATYEMAMMLAARALQEAPWRFYHPGNKTGINVKPVEPGFDERAMLKEKKA